MITHYCLKLCLRYIIHELWLFFCFFRCYFHCSEIVAMWSNNKLLFKNKFFLLKMSFCQNHSSLNCLNSDFLYAMIVQTNVSATELNSFLHYPLPPLFGGAQTILLYTQKQCFFVTCTHISNRNLLFYLRIKNVQFWRSK